MEENQPKDRYIIRNCKHHGDVKFILEGRGYYRCTKCRMDAVSRKRKKLKKDLVEYKGGKCERCGYNKCVAAMDFHHKDPSQKDFALSKNGHTRSWVSLKQEADKCELVCSNCHREIHEELNGYKDKRKDIKKQTYKNTSKNSYISRTKNIKKHNLCLMCNIATYNEYYCSDKCCKLAKRKVDRPTKEQLIEILKDNNWTKTAKMFGVSDIAVRKWAKQYGINTNRKALKLGM
jgi:DNA-binding protein Fis